MIFLKVFSAIVLVQSVQGGYDYPRPSAPFELPNNQRQPVEVRSLDDSTSQNIQNTISYSIPYEDYFYLQQRKNNDNTKNVIQTHDTIDPAHEHLRINTLQHIPSLPPVTTELSANLDALHSTVVQKPIVSELDSINAQKILNPENDLHLSVNVPKIVPPIVSLINTGSQTFNPQDVQNIDTNLLKTSSSVPSALNFESHVPNLVSVDHNVPLVLNLRDSHVSNINVQDTDIPTPESIVNVQPTLLSLQNNNHVNELQYNQLPSNSIPVQQSDSQFLNVQNTFIPTYNPQNFDSYVNLRTNQLSSNLNVEIPQLLETQNNIPQLNYQNNADQVLNVQNIVEPVITKHIYFHAPPPDIEEAPVVRASLPPNKTYKILFIKVPAQESQNNINLQSALYNQVSPIEEKTLIYVLVKKPDVPETVVLPQTKVSDHEVLFVNYKDNPILAPAGINESIVNDNSAENVLNSSLQPGPTDGY